jgi:hypothetical protein
VTRIRLPVTLGGPSHAAAPRAGVAAPVVAGSESPLPVAAEPPGRASGCSGVTVTVTVTATQWTQRAFQVANPGPVPRPNHSLGPGPRPEPGVVTPSSSVTVTSNLKAVLRDSESGRHGCLRRGRPDRMGGRSSESSRRSDSEFRTQRVIFPGPAGPDRRQIRVLGPMGAAGRAGSAAGRAGSAAAVHRDRRRRTGLAVG